MLRGPGKRPRLAGTQKLDALQSGFGRLADDVRHQEIAGRASRVTVVVPDLQDPVAVRADDAQLHGNGDTIDAHESHAQ